MVSLALKDFKLNKKNYLQLLNKISLLFFRAFTTLISGVHV